MKQKNRKDQKSKNVFFCFSIYSNIWNWNTDFWVALLIHHNTAQEQVWCVHFAYVSWNISERLVLYVSFYRWIKSTRSSWIPWFWPIFRWHTVSNIRSNISILRFFFLVFLIFTIFYLLMHQMWCECTLKIKHRSKMSCYIYFSHFYFFFFFEKTFRKESIPIIWSAFRVFFTVIRNFRVFFSIIFDHFSCPFDSVKVYDGPDNSSALIGTYCGQQRNLVLYSSESSLLVHFFTLRRTAATQNRGFKGIYEFSEGFVKLDFIRKLNN